MHTLLFLFVLLLSLPSFAASTPWEKADKSEIRLIGGALQGERYNAGLEIKFDEEWKTYWRSPGDAGLPVTIDTKGSENLKSAEILWPAPTRSIDFGTIQTFIYKHDVLLPVMVTPQDASKPVNFKAAIKYAVCKDICLFVDKVLAVTLDPKESATSDDNALLTKALGNLPKSLENAGFTATNPEIAADSKKLSLTITSPVPLENPDLLIEAGTFFRFPKPEITLSADKKTATVNAPVEPMMSDKSLHDGQPIIFTLTDGEHAYEWKYPSADAATAPVTTPTARAAENAPGDYSLNQFLVMLGFAVLGGFILNLMPCVLPVLSLKILSILKKTGKEARVVRIGLIASTLGILFSFMVLATLVVTLQAFGHNVGWGFQFQEPYFLIILAIILTVFAANLFGMFEFHLPEKFNHWIFDRTAKDHTLSHFLTGVFATLMATPCSAPFLGTAIGFAFSRGAFEVFSLFFAMGIGLAIPYILFAIFPSWIKALPKPGPWMLKARAVLGILLLATTAWLLFVLAGAAQWRLSLMISFALATLLVYFFLRPHINQRIANIIGAGLIAITLLLPQLVANPGGQYEITSGNWQNFDQAAIDKYVKDGKLVLVDVTADWCLTCKANKLLVLNKESTQTALQARGVVLMRADWTNRNTNIADYLKSFGRYGIPFNAVYGPNAPQGIPLPELLSEAAVLEALDQAKK